MGMFGMKNLKDSLIERNKINNMLYTYIKMFKKILRKNMIN